jgi:hypothetical protein
MTAPNRPSKLWWAVPAAVFLGLLVLAMFLGEAPEQKGKGNSYDASWQGYRAAYLILDELHYPVTRSRRPGGTDVRIVLAPTAVLREAKAIEQWVQEGGILVLGDDQGEFSKALGIIADVRELDLKQLEESAFGPPGVTRLAGGRTQVQWPGRRGRVWASAGGDPFVTVYPLGRGEIWLLNRPEFLRNQMIQFGDNAILLSRMADELLEERPGPLAFDEFFHGLREQPGVSQLLLRPPALWVTLQALALLGLLLWRYVPRFGALRPVPPIRRRSKEEFLDAMASLLERKGDYTDAYRTARDGLAREIEHELGLPAGAPAEQVAREAERRRQIEAPRLLRLLAANGVPTGAGAQAFLKALNELEAIHHELYGRRHR